MTRAEAAATGQDPTGTHARPALEIDGLQKSYGPNVVLRDVSLTVMPGEMTALLGENGAGKSTLARAIAGSAQPDAGVIRIDGRQVNLATPRDAIESGVAFVPQELSYLADLTVAENIVLGRVPTKFGVTSRQAILRQAADEAEQVGFDLPLSRRMGDVSMMQQQLVEVLKAFSARPRLIILDEPTAALEAEDSLKLLRLTEQLARRGVALIYISHRLDEVFAHCDTLHVLRGGELVLSGSTKDVPRAAAVEAMLDRTVEDREERRDGTPGETIVLQASGFTKAHHPLLHDVSLSVRAGEILGLYGLRGAGAETMAEAIVGLHPETDGEVVLAGRTTRIKTPRDAARAGIRHLPADRKSQGIVPDSSITQMLSLPVLRQMSRLGVMQRTRERLRATDLARRTHLRSTSLSQPVTSLSGGNQQKVLLASRLTDGVEVLVLQEPTRGVDVGARDEIHELLKSLAASGTTQIVVSSDIDEAVTLCDRLLIFREGRVVHEISNPTRASQAEALTHAGGLTE